MKYFRAVLRLVLLTVLVTSLFAFGTAKADLGVKDGGHGHEEVPQAIVISVQPGCEVSSTLGVTKPLSLSTKLIESDFVYCDPDGFATVLFPDGSTVAMRSTTSIRMSQIQTSAGRARIEVQLNSGELLADVPRNRVIKSDFYIRSPTIVTSVRGTKYRMAYDETTFVSQTTVEEGIVDIAAGAFFLGSVFEDFSLSAGQANAVTLYTVGAPMTIDCLPTFGVYKKPQGKKSKKKNKKASFTTECINQSTSDATYTLSLAAPSTCKFIGSASTLVAAGSSAKLKVPVSCKKNGTAFVTTITSVAGAGIGR